MTRNASLLLAALLLAPISTGCNDADGGDEVGVTDNDVRSGALVRLAFAQSQLPGADNLFITVSEIQLKRNSITTAVEMRARPIPDRDAELPPDGGLDEEGGDSPSQESSWNIVFSGPVTFDLLHPNLGGFQAIADAQAPSQNYEALAFTIESATLVRSGQTIPLAIDPAFHAGVTVAQPFSLAEGLNSTITLQLDAVGSVVEAAGVAPTLRPVASASVTSSAPAQ